MGKICLILAEFLELILFYFLRWVNFIIRIPVRETPLFLSQRRKNVLFFGNLRISIQKIYLYIYLLLEFYISVCDSCFFYLLNSRLLSWLVVWPLFGETIIAFNNYSNHINIIHDPKVPWHSKRVNRLVSFRVFYIFFLHRGNTSVRWAWLIMTL